MKAVIVTSCPSGVANTVIASEMLEKAASELQWQVAIECQTSFQPNTRVTDSEIESAELVIAVGDIQDKARFDSKMFYQASFEACYADPKPCLKSSSRSKPYQHPKSLKQVADHKSKNVLSVLHAQQVLRIPSCKQKPLKKLQNHKTFV